MATAVERRLPVRRTRAGVVAPNPAGCAPIQNVGACPADISAACTENSTCLQANGITCLCNPGSTGWYCPEPETGNGCPPTSVPNFGTPCAVEGAACGYIHFMCGGQARICSQGVWTPGQVIQCPQSSRRVKKDIRYLSPAEIESTADQALHLRLATYEYKAAPYAGRRHLGFIIEDRPGSPAVDRDGDMVDLYGYTSMLLATTQAQERRIELLRKQVEELSRSVQRLADPQAHAGLGGGAQSAPR